MGTSTKKDAMQVYDAVIRSLLDNGSTFTETIREFLRLSIEFNGGAYGAYFRNTNPGDGEDDWELTCVVGVDQKDLTGFAKPIRLPLFTPTRDGTGVVWSNDTATHPLFAGRMPPEHLAVRSYLAVSVPATGGGVQGAMLFGHPETGIFCEEVAEAMRGLASLATLAIDSAQRQRNLEQEVSVRMNAERLLFSVIDASASPIFAKDRQGRYTLANHATRLIKRSSVDDRIYNPIGRTDLELGFPGSDRVFENDMRVMTLGQAETFEERFLVGGVEHIFQITKSPMKNLSGEVTGLVGVAHDITQITQETEHRRLLLMELNHRVKNTLSTIQGMINATLRSTPDPAEFTEAISNRIVAIGITHNILTDTNWEFADLKDLLCSNIDHFQSYANQISVTGPKIRIQASAVVHLGMVFSELATNSVKYGALSSPSGRLDVSWRREGLDRDGVLQLHWRESDGPLCQPARRKGFGSRLLQQIERQLQGVVESLYDPAGFRCTITVPLPTILPPKKPSAFSIGTLTTADPSSSAEMLQMKSRSG